MQNRNQGGLRAWYGSNYLDPLKETVNSRFFRGDLWTPDGELGRKLQVEIEKNPDDIGTWLDQLQRPNTLNGKIELVVHTALQFGSPTTTLTHTRQALGRLYPVLRSLLGRVTRG